MMGAAGSWVEAVVKLILAKASGCAEVDAACLGCAMAAVILRQLQAGANLGDDFFGSAADVFDEGVVWFFEGGELAGQ